MAIRRLLLVLFLLRFYFPARSQSAGQYAVLIDEFLADPAPSAGLPSSSFIELKNVSGFSVNLHNWKIGTGSSTATIKTEYLLGADSFLILCPSSAEAAYRPFGPVLGITGFPSLNHDAGEIVLSSGEGAVIHAVQYDKSWYHNELKSDGGWTLEMIDLKNPCSGFSNWTASSGANGGTPGKPNSVEAENPDQ
ncbi:MAG TPA: lamin tail domain-containing protein, partial [Puia sp.]